MVSFTNNEGMTFEVPLKDGRTFDLSIPGVQVHMTVTDPSIFDISEEDMPAEYDPDAPLTDSGARAAEIDGQVEIACPPNFDAWDVLKRDRVIYNHCRLKTGEESTLKISFQSGTSFTMKPETEISINESTKEKSNFRLFFGGVWANVKKMVKGEEFGFKGSQAVAGIKGTTFVMEDTGEATTLKVIEGEVELTDTADGKKEMVRAGEALAVELRGFGEKIVFDVQTEEKNWGDPASVPAPASAVKPDTGSGTPKDNKNAADKNGGINYAFWVVLLAAAIGGSWAVKSRKK